MGTRFGCGDFFDRLGGQVLGVREEDPCLWEASAALPRTFHLVKGQ